MDVGDQRLLILGVGSGFGVVGFRVYASRFGVQGSGFRVLQRLGLRVSRVAVPQPHKRAL